MNYSEIINRNKDFLKEWIINNTSVTTVVIDYDIEVDSGAIITSGGGRSIHLFCTFKSNRVNIEPYYIELTESFNDILKVADRGRKINLLL